MPEACTKSSTRSQGTIRYPLSFRQRHIIIWGEIHLYPFFIFIFIHSIIYPYNPLVPIYVILQSSSIRKAFLVCINTRIDGVNKYFNGPD